MRGRRESSENFHLNLAGLCNFCEEAFRKKPSKLDIEMKKLFFSVSSFMDVDHPKFSSNLIYIVQKIARSLNTQIDSGVCKKQVFTVKRGSFVLI